MAAAETRKTCHGLAHERSAVATTITVSKINLRKGSEMRGGDIINVYVSHTFITIKIRAMSGLVRRSSDLSAAVADFIIDT